MILYPSFFVFLTIVFILLWLFIKTIDDRKWLSILVSLLLTPVVYFYLFYPLLNIFSSYHHEKYFNETAWKEKPALRYEMSNQIIENNLFIDKTKKEVKEALGSSEWFGWDDSLKVNSSEKWNYNLGFKPGAFNEQQECLELIFKNDMVIEVKQYQMDKSFD
ncbi:hypothetical protein [uncultured Polaribacter sp.]|uniref:hypothetical protein n=1 Tax=uncultured Polaribacter sp. TaxID=174711 RepID=UPI002608C118|nr:hypothetical protein [uncultured Polaribacter sp.]